MYALAYSRKVRACYLCLMEKLHISLTERYIYMYIYTVCPGSSDPPEKIFNIFASENEVHNIY